MPKPGIRKHLYRDKEHHAFKPKLKYNQNLPPEAPQNQETIQAILKLEVPTAIMNESSVFVYNLTVYAKNLLLLSLSKTENIENPASEVLKTSLLAEIEKNLRYLLKNLSFEDELGRLKSQAAEEPGNVEEYVKARAGAVELADIPVKEQILLNFLKNDESTSDGERKIKRIELIARVRLSLIDIKQAQGDLILAVRIAKQSLINLQAFTQAKLLVELAAENAFVPMEKIEEKKEPAKKGAKETPVIVDSNKEQKQKMLQDFLESWEFRNTPGPYFWLKTKEKLCGLLYNQSRYAEAASNAILLREEASKVSEFYFVRITYELEAYISLRLGNIDKTIENFEKMRSEGQKNVASDLQFISSLANYAEFLLERSHFADSYEVINLSKDKMWKLMDKNGFVLKPQDVNKETAGILVIKQAKEEVPAKAADPKNKNALPVAPQNPNAKEELVSVQTEADAINGTILPNLYIVGLEQFVKLEISNVKISIQEDFAKARLIKLLENIDQAEIIAQRTLHLPQIHLISIKYLRAKLFRLLFVKDVEDFQNVYKAKIGEKQKYKKIINRLPDYALGSARALLHLPNFSRRLTEE